MPLGHLPRRAATFVGTFRHGRKSYEGCPHVTICRGDAGRRDLFGLSLRIRNLIIDVAGRARAASSVQADQGLQETCLEGRTFAKSPSLWLQA